MKKILLLSIVMTVFAACSHKMHGGHGGGCACDKGKPCMADSKDCGDSKETKKEDCEDCKKAK